MKRIIVAAILLVVLLSGCNIPINEMPQNQTADCDGHALGDTWDAEDGCNICMCTLDGIACTEMDCEPETFCEKTIDCVSKDLSHPGCEGNWKCVSNQCSWKCIEEDEDDSEDETEEDTCTEGWKCKDATHKAYQNEDCTWKDSAYCQTGCSDGECNDNPCAGVSCEDSCDGSTRSYNGVCSDGVCSYSTINCTQGCEDGVCLGDPCAGVDCPNTCSGDTRKYNGSCSDGQCQYSEENCAFGCASGVCLGDNCDGVTCDDYCDGGTRYYDGSCSNGICEYSSEVCAYGCDGSVCMEYHCEWSWPQKIINKNTSEVLWNCDYTRPYCKSGTPECCKHTEELGHYDCVDKSIPDPCEGISCDDYCDGDIFYSGAHCDAGECVGYAGVMCDFGCTPEGCTDPPFGIIFQTSEKWNGNLGGLAGADLKCMTAASNAGLNGTWKALLSTSTVDAKDRIPDVVYKRMDATVIANNKADLFDGTILATININENGSIEGWTHVFTGSISDGTKRVGANCSNWTLNSGNGERGINEYSNFNWIAAGNTNSCGSDVSSLYCVRTA